MIGTLGLALGVLVLGGTASEARAGEIVPFKDARIKFEVNATDGDGGIQIFVDADGWRWLRIYDPNGREIFETVTRGRIAKQGGTELFLESAEPDFVELPLDELLARFPEGTYRFKARGLEGETMEGAATVSHDIPEGAKLLSPLGPMPLQDPSATVLRWESVPPPNGGPIIGYEVLVVESNTGLPALPKIPLDVIMPPTATSLAVPPGFLQPDTEYEWEVLAIEAGGNQTLSSSTLRTAP
jgi:hypothetical protein